MTDTRIVVLAVDGSEHSENAFDWYLGKMRKDGDLLIFVYVTEPPSLPVFSLKSGISAPTEKWKEILEKQQKVVTELEDTFVARAQAAKLNYQFIHAQNENAGPGIVAKSKEKNAHLIIIGTRGQNKLRRTILGSVSDYVLHHVDIPVAVVPAAKAADQE